MVNFDHWPKSALLKNPPPSEGLDQIRLGNVAFRQVLGQEPERPFVGREGFWASHSAATRQKSIRVEDFNILGEQSHGKADRSRRRVAAGDSARRQYIG